MTAPISCWVRSSIVRSVQASLTRAKILDGARRTFADRGWHGSGIRAIAQASGCSVGAITHHFDNMAALYQEAMGQRPPDGPLANASPQLLSALKAMVAAYRSAVPNADEPPAVREALEAIAMAETPSTQP